MGKTIFVAVTADPISGESLSKKVSTPTSGAVVTFSGDVRNHDKGRQVTSMDYEAHPSAEKVLNEIANEIVEQYSIEAIAIAHRFGPLAIGDSALVVAVAAAHRQDAFDACNAAVEAVKARIPVWKHQFFSDGTDEWVNSA